MGKNILITGAGRGIGLVMTRQLAESGHTILAVSKNISDSLSSIAEAYSGRVFIRQTDVSDEDDVINAASYLAEKNIQLDIVINNAAVHLESHRPDISAVDFSVYVPTYAVNSIAPLIVAKHFLPHMKTPAKFISISSEAGSIADCWRKSEFSYCMSKSALNMGMRILQNRVAEMNIKVLCIHPGWVRTKMGGKDADLSPEESASSVLKQILADHKIDGPMYIDWNGNEMKW